jgi:glycosyltransferase involved in cell wall biosynthesis
MKALHVISSIDPRHGGVSEGLRQLGEVSIELGCQVEAVTLDTPGQEFLGQLPFPVHALGPGLTHFHYNPQLVKWLLAHVQVYDIVVVHALWQYHSVAVRQACLKRNVPYVVYTHGMLDPYFKRAYPLKHARKWLFWPWADYRVLRDASAVLFTTEEERLLARQSFWLYSANEVVVNLGTTRPPGNPEAQRAAFYREHPELASRRLALFMGRIHAKKGCDLAIEAFARVFGPHPEWQLVMAGPDQTGWRSELMQLTERLGITERVTWTGMLSADVKWGALHAAEFFLRPSHQENFGVVVAEALACGVPALISNKVNIWREIEVSNAGLVAADTLAGTVALLEQWMSLGVAGQNRLRSNALPCFNEKFEIHRATKNLLSILGSILPVRQPSDAYVNA